MSENQICLRLLALPLASSMRRRLCQEKFECFWAPVDLDNFAADQREAEQVGGTKEPHCKELPFPHPRNVFVFVRRGALSRPCLLRRREVLTGLPSSRTIASGGMGADPLRRRAASGSCWLIFRIWLCLTGTVVCLSPRFYSHWVRSPGRLLDGVPRFGGALLSQPRSRGS
jgi:hypothetical protein